MIFLPRRLRARTLHQFPEFSGNLACEICRQIDRETGREIMKPPSITGAMFGLLLLLLWALPLGGQEPAEVERQLQEIRRNIEQLTEQLDQDIDARGQATRDLREVETEIGRLGAEIRLADRDLGRHQADLEALSQRELELSTDLEGQRAYLAAQLRAAYAIGRQPVLKLLLNLEDVRAVGRSLAYFRFYNDARLKEIAAVRENLVSLAEVRRELITARDRIAGLRQELITRRQAKAEQTEKRRQLLYALNTSVTQSEQQLGALEQDRQRLETLLLELSEMFAGVPTGEGFQPFSGQRGALRWPLEGAPLLGIGETKPGGMSREGILIAASRGADVKAISYGRVAYADWLRGFGLIAIIDHGEGYMSLYAFNESLFTEIGNWVSAGETIAAVGDSGGRKQPALYFELRHDGKPVDPADWFTEKR